MLKKLTELSSTDLTINISSSSDNCSEILQEEVAVITSTTTPQTTAKEISSTTNSVISIDDDEKLENNKSLENCTRVSVEESNTPPPLIPVTTVTTSSTIATSITGSVTSTAITGSVTSTKTTSAGQQVVIIQGPGLKGPFPIRIASSGTSSVAGSQGSNTSKKAPIQLLKLNDGTLIHLKNKGLNISNIKNIQKVSTDTSGKKLIIKNAPGTTPPSTVVAASSSKSTESVSNSLGAQLLKSTLEPSKLKSSTTITTVTSTKSTTVTSSAANGQTKPDATKTILKNKDTKITFSSGESNSTGSSGAVSTAGPKQVFVPHHVLKLAQNKTASGGSIQAIQIPGKSGVQYVRVMGTTAGAVKGSTTMTSSNNSSTKDKLENISILQSKTNQKIILNSKPSDNKTTATVTAAPKILNKEIALASSMKQQKSLITFPTLKKINTFPLVKNENAKSILIKKEKLDSDNGEQKKKVPQLYMVSKDFIKNLKQNSASAVIEESKQSLENSTVKKHVVMTTPKVLYSVLKSNQTETQQELLIKKEDTIDDDDDIGGDDGCGGYFDLPNEDGSKRRSLSPPSLTDVRRKHCNCTKSQCLKLYCDCFANGEFCSHCNCKECYNTLEYEGERQKAIRMCLERNPNAFKPKITKSREQSDLRLHNKGCHCKRSGCLKNYCECYEAKITCSSNCKCVGCRNLEGIEHDARMNLAANINRSGIKRNYEEMNNDTVIPGINPSTSTFANTSNESIIKQPYNFITEEVVDATVQCMFAQMDECKKTGINGRNSERMIIEELGRCLVEIIDFSIRNTDN